jgi:hypothetical protein
LNGIFFQKPAGDRFLRFDRAIFTGSGAGSHQRHTHTVHDGLDVGEIQIDQSRHDNQVGDALNGLPEDVVRDSECVEETGASFESGEQALIWES